MRKTVLVLMLVILSIFVFSEIKSINYYDNKENIVVLIELDHQVQPTKVSFGWNESETVYYLELNDNYLENSFLPVSKGPLEGIQVINTNKGVNIFLFTILPTEINWYALNNKVFVLIPKSISNKTLNYSFMNTPIDIVVRELANTIGLDVSLYEGVRNKRVNLVVSNATIEEAFRQLLLNNPDISYAFDPNKTIYIGTPEEISQNFARYWYIYEGEVNSDKIKQLLGSGTFVNYLKDKSKIFVYGGIREHRMIAEAISSTPSEGWHYFTYETDENTLTDFLNNISQMYEFKFVILKGLKQVAVYSNNSVANTIGYFISILKSEELYNELNMEKVKVNYPERIKNVLDKIGIKNNLIGEYIEVPKNNVPLVMSLNNDRVIGNPYRMVLDNVYLETVNNAISYLNISPDDSKVTETNGKIFVTLFITEEKFKRFQQFIEIASTKTAKIKLDEVLIEKYPVKVLSKDSNGILIEGKEKVVDELINLAKEYELQQKAEMEKAEKSNIVKYTLELLPTDPSLEIFEVLLGATPSYFTENYAIFEVKKDELNSFKEKVNNIRNDFGKKTKYLEGYEVDETLKSLIKELYDVDVIPLKNGYILRGLNVDKAIDFAKVYATEKENIEIVSKSLNIELENSNEIVDMLKNIYDVDSTYFAGLKVLYLKGKKESVESAIEFVQSLLESQPPKEAKFKVLNVAATDQLKNILAELTDLQVFTYQEKTILYGTQDSISKAEEIINNIISENVVTRIETNLDYEQVQKFVAFLFGEDVKVINIGNSIYFKGPKIYVDEVIKQINLISSSESVKSEEENKNNIFVKDNLINIDVSDAPLADVIKTIYSQLGYSIVVDGIEDKITLKLENASIEDFEKIISEKVSIEKENNFISIKPKESENAQVVSDEIVKYENGLFSIDAEDVPVDELIREVMKKVGYSAIISKDINIRSNIFAKDITFDNFINILNNYNISVDKKDDIYFFNETTTEATQNIDKFIFSVPRGSEKVKQLVAFYGGQTFVDTESGMVIATGISAKSASEIKEYIESLLEVKLASIEVKVIDEDMNDSAELDLGKISTALGELSNNGLSINLALSDLSFEKIAEKILNSGNSNIDMTNSTISKTLSNSNIVANPNVVAKSGETANIIIGDRLPIILKDAEGNESIQYLQSGVILEITPFINADNTIDLKLRIEVSTFDWEVGASSVSKLPVEKTREFRSSLTLKNGQTLIIGGLTRDEKITSTSKLPILGDLPIIGKFFSKQSEKFTKRNLIIFITAKVIE
ncbi:MAG: hypothetical protein PWP54_333 [Thermosipho sp. (in: thermotogales)]|nr:hypothetical protein [Thermosipho sp. (in: thermotogales)]MDN5324780.1 hypothetical protein [Thermosipho sp. (in: thermotogales)]